MSSDQGGSISRSDIKSMGKAAGEGAGKEVANRLGPKLEDVQEEIRRTNRAVEDLSDDVNQLERRINNIEQAKAEAERRAIEDLKDRLKDQVEEKRREYERRVGEVLDDYRGSIERLKDRFIGSISGHGDNFDTVEGEFEGVLEAREAVTEHSAELSGPSASTYRERTNDVLESRNAFFEHIDAFLEDREETAATIESLQTDVRGMDSRATVTVPFWVIGVERGGSEEIHVLPVLERGDPSGSPSRENPYASRLGSHPTHGYDAMTDAVHSYVSQDGIRDALARRDDDTYVDPGFLEREGAAKSRFVEALREFELDGHGGSSPPTVDTEPGAEVDTDTDEESAPEQEVRADG